MKPIRLAVLAALAFAVALPASAKPARHAKPIPPAQTAPAAPGKPHNVIVFVADGLRYDSVNPDVAPTFARIRKDGVDFANSHSIYPTVTTANASAIASGHYLGDTGDYGNTLFVDFPVPCRLGAVVTFLEDDCVLRDVKDHFHDGYMGQTTLIGAARAAGFNTAILGKKGPAAIQNLGSLDAKDARVDDPLGVFIDDATNRPANADGTPTRSTRLNGALGAEAFAVSGDDRPAFTSAPNLTQQAWLVSIAAQALVPDLKDNGKPFVMLYWSRDPDATQHSAIDSEGRLVPGINSPSARIAIASADFQLRVLMEALKLAGQDGNTDIFVTADHGFSTIAKGTPPADGSTPPASLPQGFLAFDVAAWLGGQKLFDPDRSNTEIIRDDGDRPSQGNALIGPTPDAPVAIVASNGGSDFIYAPGPNGAATAKAVFAKLVSAPYVGALFVNDALLGADPAAFAGALPMSKINLIGSSNVPRPAIVVGFRSFLAKGCTAPQALLCTVEIADTPLHTGQGMHGTFSRADTRNFMAAIGPDFRKGFVDTAPVSNADIAPTIAHILGISLAGPGTLTGRPATEALAGGAPVKATSGTLRSAPGAGGLATVLEYQDVGGVRYFDAGGIPGRTVGLKAK
ncbi:MAG: alkaline phosphatase family protein [Rhizomicrobium sp.]